MIYVLSPAVAVATTQAVSVQLEGCPQELIPVPSSLLQVSQQALAQAAAAYTGLHTHMQAQSIEGCQAGGSQGIHVTEGRQEALDTQPKVTTFSELCTDSWQTQGECGSTFMYNSKAMFTRISHLQQDSYKWNKLREARLSNITLLYVLGKKDFQKQMFPMKMSLNFRSICS